MSTASPPHPQHFHPLLHIVPEGGDDLSGEKPPVLVLYLESHHAQPDVEVSYQEPGLEAVRKTTDLRGKRREGEGGGREERGRGRGEGRVGGGREGEKEE